MKRNLGTVLRLCRGVLVVLLLTLQFSCTSKPEELCLGKWSTEDGATKIELFKGGRIQITERHVLVHGKYVFLDQDKIKVELDGYEHVGGPPVISVVISKNEMTWTYPNGDVLKYKRAS